MKNKKKLFTLLFSTFLGISTAYALPMTCSCTEGNMRIETTDSGWEMSCTDGGRVSCVIE